MGKYSQGAGPAPYGAAGVNHEAEVPKPHGMMPYENARVLIDRLVLNKKFEGKLIIEVIGTTARLMVDKSTSYVKVIMSENDL